MSRHTLLSILLKPPPPHSVFPIDTPLSRTVDFLNIAPSHFVTLSCGKKKKINRSIMIIMFSSRLTSMYHIVRAAGRIEGVCRTGLQIVLLQFLIGVKLLFWWRHKYLTSLGIIEFDMVDRHPHGSCTQLDSSVCLTQTKKCQRIPAEAT